MQKKKEEVRAYQTPIPFPQRPKQSKLDNLVCQVLECVQILEINISFAEAIARMPHYEKFMKDMISAQKVLF